MTIINALPFNLQNGQTADATQVDANFAEIVTDVNNNAAHNGANNDITSLSGLTTPITPTVGGSNVYVGGTSTGSANAQVVATPVPTGFALTAGNRIVFLAGFTNTGAMTLNVAAAGATAVLRYTPAGPIALIGGEVVSGNYVEAVFDGTQFVLYSNASTPDLGPLASLASATTTDLGTISSHNVLISGTTTITSFGSTAVATYPVYRLKFSGALLLTYNATSLILPGVANITTAANDTAVALYLGSGNWQIIEYQKANGPPIGNIAPTTQVFTSGSGTYTPTSSNVRWIAVRCIGGGGGGGGGQNATPGVTGGSTTFGTLTAVGGVGGALASAGTGGSASGGYSNLVGGAGGAPTPPGTAYNGWGGIGGSSAVGGGGAPSIGSSAASAGGANTGGGGGGGGATNGTLTGSGAAGGGAGGCTLAVLAATTYSYSVGAGGAGASGSSSASSAGGTGGAGAAGRIEVVEYY